MQGSSDSGKGGSDFTTPVLEDDKGKACARAGSRRTSTSSATASVSSVTMESAAAQVADNAEEQASESASVDAASAADAPNQMVVHEFAIPLHLVGRLIGKHGCFVAQIKAETDSQIQVKKHPLQHKYKLCSLEGRYSQKQYLVLLKISQQHQICIL